MSKTIFITGGTGTVGKQLVKNFIDDDCVVITTSRSKETKEKLLKEINSSLLHVIEVDLSFKDSYSIISDYLLKNNLHPSVLINNARNKENLIITDNLHISDQKWLDEYFLDVVVPYKLITSFALDKKIPLRRVINISSIYGIVAQNPMLYENPSISLAPQYGAAKSALIQLTKDLAVQLAKMNITINAVSFGGIKTNNSAEFLKRYSEIVPLRRMMDISEVFGIIQMLAGEESSYITGQNFIIDGGFSAW